MMGRSESMVREVQGGQDMTDVLARIESALRRSEAAAERLRQRHRGLRNAASETLSSLDRLIESERMRSHG